MIKPKTHLYKLKLYLSKLEAVNNKVSSRCHASAKIDNEQLTFKGSPQLKKNTAIFNSQIEFDNYQIRFDEATNLYENKYGLVIVQLETQGTRIKIGEVSVNLGAVLNEKKYRIVNSYPLVKCYDKTAKIKLSVDFIPISTTSDNILKEIKQKREINTAQSQSFERPLQLDTLNQYKQLNIKSRLAQQSNYILQQKIYQYEQKMDNYRMTQTQLQQRLQEQIENKDEKIGEVLSELAKKNYVINNLNIQVEQSRFRIKEVEDENYNLRENYKHMQNDSENLHHQQQNLHKQYQSLKISLETLSKTKQNKQKHFSTELLKYTNKYLESEQQRNNIIFELQSKFKEEMEKKDKRYKEIIAANQRKYNEGVNDFKEQLGKVEERRGELEEKAFELEGELKKVNNVLELRIGEIQQKNKIIADQEEQIIMLKQKSTNLSYELQTLNFSYNQETRQLSSRKYQIAGLKKSIEQLKMQIQMANQTIEQQRRSLTKYSKQLQVHQQREYYLTEKYSEEIEVKSMNEESIRGQNRYYSQQLLKFRNKLNLSEERYEEEIQKNAQLVDCIRKMQQDNSNRNFQMIKLEQDRVRFQTDNSTLKSDMNEMQQAFMMLKEENYQLMERLEDARKANSNDRSMEWAMKIEELQNDIGIMVDKFRLEKESMREANRKEQSYRKEEISRLQTQYKKINDQLETYKSINHQRQYKQKQEDHKIEQLRHQNQQITIQLTSARQKIYHLTSEKQHLITNFHQKESKIQKSLVVQRVDSIDISKQRHIESIKSGLKQTIINILEFMTKPFQSIVSYHEIYNADIDGETLRFINSSLRKYCEERNRVKNIVKKMEDDLERKNNDKSDQSQVLQKRRNQFYWINDHYLQDSMHNHDYVKQYKASFVQNPTQKLKFSELSIENEDLRSQKASLSKQKSEWKVKQKRYEQQIRKLQKTIQTDRYEYNSLKAQLEDAQDEMSKFQFLIKKKEKMISEYEMEIRDLDGELIAARNNQSGNTGTNKNAYASRNDIRKREKEEGVKASHNAIIIKDLETKLQQKKVQLEQQETTLSKYKSDLSTTTQQLQNSQNETKVLQKKLKQKANKLFQLQKGIAEMKKSVEQQLQSESIRTNRMVENIKERLTQKEEQNRSLCQRISDVEKQLELMEVKCRELVEEHRRQEGKARREGEKNIALLKSQILKLQTSNMQLTSTNKNYQQHKLQHSSKLQTLQSTLSKRTSEINSLESKIKLLRQKLTETQDELQQTKSQLNLKNRRFKQIIEDYEQKIQLKDYQLQQSKFTSQGKIIDLQKQLEDIESNLTTLKRY